MKAYYIVVLDYLSGTVNIYSQVFLPFEGIEKEQDKIIEYLSNSEGYVLSEIEYMYSEDMIPIKY